MTTATDLAIPKSEAANGRALLKGFEYYLALAGHEVDGMRPGQIAKATGVSPATATRDLQAMQSRGIVELVPGMEDRWRLGPKVVQIALAHLQGLERAGNRVSETKQRYSREPK